MNNIGSSVYENLTPRQRIVACIEAEARGDEEEKRRLQPKMSGETRKLLILDIRIKKGGGGGRAAFLSPIVRIWLVRYAAEEEEAISPSEI